MEGADELGMRFFAVITDMEKMTGGESANAFIEMITDGVVVKNVNGPAMGV